MSSKCLPAACLAAVPLLASVVTAQIQGALLPGTVRIVPPADIADVVYRRSMVASVTGTGLPDVVCLATGTVAGMSRSVVLLAAAPGIHTSFRQLKGTGAIDVNDVAVLRPSGSSSRDALAFVTPTGLYRWTLGGDEEGRNIERLGGNLWNGATMVRTGQIDGLMGDDIVGVVASGTRLRVMPDGDAQWFHEMNATIADLAVADVCAEAAGASSADEIVVATADGVSLIRGKAVYANVPLVNAGIHIQPLRTPVGCFIAVAWTDTATTPGHHLWVLDGNLSVLSTWDNAPAIQGMTATDADHDGDDDLLVTVEGALNARRLSYTGIGNGFTSQTIPYQSGVFAAGTSIAPLDLDFDGDGDDDMFVPKADGTVALLRNQYVANGASFFRRQARGASRVEMQFSSLVPRPAWASHIEVVQWQLRRVFPAGGGAAIGLVLEPVSSLPQLCSIESVPPPQNGDPWDAYANVDLDQPLTEDPVVMATRFVKVEVDQVVFRGGVKLSALAVGLDDDALLQDLLQQHILQVYDGPPLWETKQLVTEELSPLANQFGGPYAPESDNTRGIGVVIDPPDLPDPKDGDTPETPEPPVEPEGG